MFEFHDGDVVLLSEIAAIDQYHTCEECAHVNLVLKSGIAFHVGVRILDVKDGVAKGKQLRKDYDALKLAFKEWLASTVPTI